MILSKMKLRKGICSLLACVFMTACGNTEHNTQFEFNFNDSQRNDFSRQKSIYINESKDELVLNASLKIDGGKAEIEVIGSDSKETVNSFSYEKDADFDIVLKDVQEGQEYIISVKAEQTNKISLVVNASEKLVRDKEKPNKEKGKT